MCLCEFKGSYSLWVFNVVYLLIKNYVPVQKEPIVLSDCMLGPAATCAMKRSIILTQ